MSIEVKSCHPSFGASSSLLFLWTLPHIFSLQVRQSAGLLLKNNLKYHYAGATEDLRHYIKVCVSFALTMYLSFLNRSPIKNTPASKN